ncbi:MAG: PorT family protein [Saprospiraceae bacterium]|nr:PorT family protein [Saprospiraceae bacterium]
MKKYLFAIALGVMYTSATWAQVGIKAGAAFATISEENENVSRDDIENRSIVAPVVGLTFGMNLGDILTIQPELLYTQNGGSNTYNVLGTETKNTYRIHYLELPVLAKLQFGNADQEGLGFHIAAGPWVGYALGGKYTTKTTADGTTLFEAEDNFTFDEEDDTRRLNYGMLGSAGVSIGNIVLDLRYNYGFNNLLDKDADNTNDNKPVRQTRGVALTLGVNF